MYFPKNKIITNLFTSGEEYITLEGEDYIGFYHKLYTGKYFTGKTPEDKPTTEIFPSVDSDDDRLQILTPQKFNSISIVDEAYLLQQFPNLGDRLIPTQHYPKPTENDYKVGNFKRYFCVKANENSYLELDKKTYDKLSSKNSNWAYELYVTFFLVWYITGEESQVESTNKNLVLIQEQRSNRRGLKEFLRENYTKFWIPQ